MPNRRSGAARGRGGGREPGSGASADGAVVPPGSEGTSGPVRDSGLPWELPHTFLGLDEEASDFSTSRAFILPVPYESTTSFGGGTRSGPNGILDASRYIELWDQELQTDPSTVGIHTLPAFELTRAGAGPAMEELEMAFGRVLDLVGDRFPVMLGGEHSVSAPAIRATAARQSARLHVLQFDAHADLRDSYQGTSLSHACTMRRVFESTRGILQVGLRSLSKKEALFLESEADWPVVWARETWESDEWMDRAIDSLPEAVYLTVDVDGFDLRYQGKHGI